MTRAVVSEKGQVTIPKALRDSLGIRAGTELKFEEKDGALVAVPVVPTDPIDALVGLGERQDVDRFLAAARGPRGRSLEGVPATGRTPRDRPSRLPRGRACQGARRAPAVPRPRLPAPILHGSRRDRSERRILTGGCPRSTIVP